MYVAYEAQYLIRKMTLGYSYLQFAGGKNERILMQFDVFTWYLLFGSQYSI